MIAHRFKGRNRADAVLVAVNWHDNPWFPDVLDQEKVTDYASGPETADHVWGGNYEIVSEASYYARLIAEGSARAASAISRMIRQCLSTPPGTSASTTIPPSGSFRTTVSG